MGPLAVVTLQPVVRHLADLGQRGEDLGIQDFRPPRLVEAFDAGTLVRLGGLNVLEYDTVLGTPFG